MTTEKKRWIPKPRWPGDTGDPKKKKEWKTYGAPRAVRPEIYGVMPVAQVESMLRGDEMPAPFIRRMRVINLLSALTLRKIEDDMIAPFEVMDIHHVLDEQISQDAIIAMLENKNLALALETGNLQPLWVESKDKPLLRKGFEQGWMQRFTKTPFDPICVMLATRAKLMMDVVDEEGHSYDLLKAMGMGWIDFGEIPGEEIGDPETYVPPVINQPIDFPDFPAPPAPGEPDYVPGPGETGYIPPADLTPTDPGYVPGPGEPGYVHPFDIVPGEDGHVADIDSINYVAPPLRMPGEPGFGGAPGESPDYPAGWNEGIFPSHPEYDPGRGESGYEYPRSPGGGYYGGDYGPGGEGAPGGPYGAGGDYVSVVPPLPFGYGPGWMFSGRGFGIGWFGDGIDCCLDKDDPEAYVHIGYFTASINAGDALGLTVAGAHEDCEGDNYEWIEVNGVGSLDSETGLSVIYTAPATGHNCPGNAEIQLICNSEVVDTLAVTINYDYAISFVYPEPETEVVREHSVAVNVSANGTPLTWAVAGTGFTLSHAETAGTGNVLLADETACGTATITITDCDGNVAIGEVRCTEGQWVLKSSNVCEMAGVVGVVTPSGGSPTTRFYITGIKGKGKQVDDRLYSGAGTHKIEGPGTECDDVISEYCNPENECMVYTIPCSTLQAPYNTVCCVDGQCRGDCTCAWPIDHENRYCSFGYYNYALNARNYYEWEC